MAESSCIHSYGKWEISGKELVSYKAQRGGWKYSRTALGFNVLLGARALAPLSELCERLTVPDNRGEGVAAAQPTTFICLGRRNSTSLDGAASFMDDNTMRMESSAEVSPAAFA
ncbi:uncharacterized protein BDCG_17926 [Blastomyces dermatitidis ER-3]|uniref:Uncharacterized protein n=1 Tax=Ajellomyces dermatitidis (strain ER-3 / ATCC MYA-2586) TaxID=559297 RepID=A0ABX2W138_AJEDR|nr:uncharacterized protein BDCG_17926 [Blastomyces dermatitidis ER-3]OAT03095.1 hypothetical protein BDCG_17926 [Blastomyces dermatitidis ER-3]